MNWIPVYLEGPKWFECLSPGTWLMTEGAQAFREMKQLVMRRNNRGCHSINLKNILKEKGEYHPYQSPLKVLQ